MEDTHHEDRSGRFVLRTYGQLWRPERRIHAIEGHRIPFPGGLPIVAALYFIALLALVLVVGRLPVLGDLLGLAPAPVRYVLAPAVGAAALWRMRPDGRSAPAAAATRALHLVRPSRSVAGRRARSGLLNRPARVPIAPDLTGPPVPGRLCGQGEVCFGLPLERHRGRWRPARRPLQGRRRLRLLPGAPQEVEL